MPTPATRVIALALCLLAAGCASRPLPKYERPLARAKFQTVRTTAYTHTEDDHVQYSNRNACGDSLRSGSLNSASCDWSRWPVGTVFRIQETGESYVVDDYGWALSGTNTIDLYKASRSAMNAWGTRRVHIEHLQWGEVRRILAILAPRAKHAHVRRMVREIRSRYAELAKPLPQGPSIAAGSQPKPVPARAVALAEAASASEIAPAPPSSRRLLTPTHPIAAD